MSPHSSSACRRAIRGALPARRVTEAATLTAIDDRVGDAAQGKTPKQLQTWLLRLVVQSEPLAFEERNRRALADRRVTVVQGVDGIGYVTGEVSAADAAAIDAMLAAAARSLGADDPRSEQQRRADLFADLLLGRLTFDDDTTDDDTDSSDTDNDDSHSVGGNGESDSGDATPAEQTTDNTDNTDSAEPVEADTGEWLEVEVIDPDTGELLGTQLQPVDGDGQPTGKPVDPVTHQRLGHTPKLIRRPRTIRIGVVVALSSLLGAADTPAELTDRSGFIPAETLRHHIADAIGTDSRTQILFTRLLTDDGGRLLDTTELGRYASTRLTEAIKIRAGTCRFPTCTVPADRCDLDHHQPHPHGPTCASNEDPFVDDTTEAKPSPGRPAPETTTASTGPCPTPNTTDASTNHYPQE